MFGLLEKARAYALKLHNCFVYFIQKINSLIHLFILLPQLLSYQGFEFFFFLILLSHQNKDLITAE